MNHRAARWSSSCLVVTAIVVTKVACSSSTDGGDRADGSSTVGSTRAGGGGGGGTAGETAGAGGDSGASAGRGGKIGSDGGGGADSGDDGGGRGGGAGVLQHHNHLNRDGLYIDSAFTRAAVAGGLRSDTTFKVTIEGPTYAQPLYFDGGPGGRDIMIVATEQNIVYALDGIDGSVVWQKKLGTPVLRAKLPCGNIDPLGITGTPVIDAASRTLFVAAMTTPDDGTTKKHLIFALSLTDGSTLAGWPLDVSATISSGGTPFVSLFQNQRSALALVAGTLYVTYSGHSGDCGDYHGWVVSVPTARPSEARGFATGLRGGIWGVAGPASDGTSVFVTTGNTAGTTTWAFGEAVLRFQGGATFSGQTQDYFTPSDWKTLDDIDGDLGANGALVVDAPGATPSQLVVQVGKTGFVYLLDRSNLGGIGRGDGGMGEGLSSVRVSTGGGGAGAAYNAPGGTYVAVHGVSLDGNPCDLTAIKIMPTSPPTAVVTWCSREDGSGSPIVTTPDGKSDFIVWAVGAEIANQLRGFDGETGALVFDGGPSQTMTQLRHFLAPIVAKGRIFVASDATVYSFAVQ